MSRKGPNSTVSGRDDNTVACSVHVNRPAKLECMACFKKYGYGHGNVFCTPECFRAHWDTHKYEGQPPFQSPARGPNGKVFSTNLEHVHSNGSFSATDSALFAQGSEAAARRAQASHQYKTPPRGRIPVQGS